MEAVYALAGIAAAAAGMWYWKKEAVCEFRPLKGKEAALGGSAILLSVFVSVILEIREWDLLLNIKILVIYTALLAASVVDWKKRIISNRLVAAALIIRLVIFIMEFFLRKETFLQSTAASFWGLLFGFGFLFLVSILSKRSIGFGDVKLFAAIGIYMGFWGTFNVLFYSLLYCAVVSIVLLAAKKADRKARIPFAPFIFAGYVTAVLLQAF